MERFDWAWKARIPYHWRRRYREDLCLLPQNSQSFKFQQSLIQLIHHSYNHPSANYIPLNKYINAQKLTSSEVKHKVPSKPEEREGLIRSIQEQIIKISPKDSLVTPQQEQKKAILEQRIKLIENCHEYSETRLSNLQKIFKHYSTHLFRSGQKYDFDQIGYLNEHLIIERFFAFINDFKLNQVMFNGEICQLADRNDIILIFKKSSSNARNLDLPEFIACLQRLFVFLFNQNQGFKDKRQRLQKEKQVRAQEAKKRQKLKQERIKMKAKGPAINLSVSLPAAAKVENPESKQAKQNDEMMNQMMKDFQIVNPNDEISNAVKQVKQESSSEKLYQITDQQKIQSYWQRIGIDDKKQIDKRLRYFEKANFKFFEVEELQKYREGQPKKQEQQKGNQPLNLKKQLTSIHDEWKNDKREIEKINASRLMNVAGKLSERQLQKSKIHISRSLSREEYDNKRKKMDEKFTKKQLNLMLPTAKQRTNKLKQQGVEAVYYNLEMLHRSTPNNMPIGKITSNRYGSSDPTDSIYLQEYNVPKFIGNRAKSSFSKDKSEIVESTKRRAYELQNQEAKKISRLTVNLHQNQHYLQKFLQRKW